MGPSRFGVGGLGFRSCEEAEQRGGVLQQREQRSHFPALRRLGVGCRVEFAALWDKTYYRKTRTTRKCSHPLEELVTQPLIHIFLPTYVPTYIDALESICRPSTQHARKDVEQDGVGLPLRNQDGKQAAGGKRRGNDCGLQCAEDPSGCHVLERRMHTSCLLAFRHRCTT